MHLAVPLLFVTDILAFVDAAGLPSELPVAVFLVVFIRALVLIAGLATVLSFPVALARLDPVEELTCVDVAVLPAVLAVALRLSLIILTNVVVAAGKQVSALPVSEAHFPFAFVRVAVAPDVLAESVGLIFLPLADESVSIDALPMAVAALEALAPESVKKLACYPSVFPLTVNTAFVIFAQKSIARGKPFEAAAMPDIVEPAALVQAARPVSDDAFATSLHVVVQLADVLRLFEHFHGKVLLKLQILPVKQLGIFWLVIQKALLFITVQLMQGCTLLLLYLIFAFFDRPVGVEAFFARAGQLQIRQLRRRLILLVGVLRYSAHLTLEVSRLL